MRREVPQHKDSISTGPTSDPVRRSPDANAPKPRVIPAPPGWRQFDQCVFSYLRPTETGSGKQECDAGQIFLRI